MRTIDKLILAATLVIAIGCWVAIARADETQPEAPGPTQPKPPTTDEQLAQCRLALRNAGDALVRFGIQMQDAAKGPQ